MTVPREETATIVHPVMMVAGDRIGLLSLVSALSTSREHPSSNPMLDEWILLARAIVDVMAA